jgi:hypothetical protein
MRTLFRKSQPVARLRADTLLINVQRHYWMNFPHRITFRLASPVWMIRWRVGNVIDALPVLMLRAGTRIGDGSSVTRQRTHPNNCDHSGVVLRWAIIEDKA